MLKNKSKSIISILLIVCMIMSFIPSAFAAQSNEYVDPADSWLPSNNRTNEFDINATTTNETYYCLVCDKDTTFIAYRVPEYTKSGETALNRSVKYSDGTCIDGKSKGNLDSGVPGVNAYYTGYHWTKIVCQTCGTINGSNGAISYEFSKNVYVLNSCDHSFFLDFDATTYEQYDEDEHITTLKRGEYCQFCKGTFARASEGLEAHDFTQTVEAQIGHNRFCVSETCRDCGYKKDEYITAKSVVTSYYGIEDGDAHTLTVSDLSDNGVRTSIRYGTSAESCTKTSAPNYTDAGYYTVYYEIDYAYSGEVMTENGVSYVWLVNEDDDKTIIVLPSNQNHEHDYHYLETIKPSCEELGYDRFQCNGCGDLTKTNYTPAKGHNHQAINIREATCMRKGRTIWLCNECGDFYEVETTLAEHKYMSERHNPTCRNVGYTEYTCEVCGDNYINNIQPLVSHSYERITKEPTCVDRGYTTSTCTMCGYNYVDDYTDALGHSWDEGRTVTSSTCVGEGVVEYLCLNECGEKMIKATDANGHTPGAEATCTEPQICEVCKTVLELPLGHHYSEETVRPTCTAMGYTIYTCECGNTHTGDYTDAVSHSFEKTTVAPTCEEHGYTTYSCRNCDAKYVSDYTERTEHTYTETVTAPTCTTLGFTTFTCECGDTYKSDYTEPLGHTPSEWIVDVPATIEAEGSKHIECIVCGEILFTTALPQLIDKDNSDEDGKAEVGDYTIILTDENGKPIFNSELTIDVNDNVSIKLTNGRLLDFAKPTTITATYTATKQPKENLKIYIEDVNGNKAIGHTNADGILVVPNNKTNTNDDNGTIGKEDGETKETFVITVTDKANVIIPNCEIYIGESNNVVVDLPEGIKPTREEPVIVTITDHNGNAQSNVTVIALGDADFIEKGETDVYGVVILPSASEGYTDENGRVNVDNISVVVSDEAGSIENAYVIHNEDGSISVTLPEDRTMGYDNRITVSVSNSLGEPMEDIAVSVTEATTPDGEDGEEPESLSGRTDKNGIVTLPPLNEDVTDNEGNSGVKETPEDKEETTEYKVLVNDTKSVITDALVKIEKGKVTVTLPETHTLTTSNQTTVTVTDSADKAVKGVSVTVKDKSTSKSGTTDANGKVTLPVKSSSGGGGGGSSSGGGGGGGSYYGGGISSSYTTTNIKVVDKDGKAVSVSRTTNAKGEITLTLPSGKTVDAENYYTITATDNSGKAKVDVVVTLKDRNGKSESGTTDKKGTLILPGVTHTAYVFGYPNGEFRPDGDMLRSEAAAIFARLISERKGEEISGRATFADVKPSAWYYEYVGYLEDYDVIRGYTDNTFRADEPVSRAEFVAMTVRFYDIFEDVKKTGYTVNYSDVSSRYWAYNDIAFAKNIGWLNGYADGTFKGDNNITRAEVVTVTNHATDRTPDEDYINRNVSTLNKFTDLKNNSHWAYYDIMEAANTHIGAVSEENESWVK